MIAVRLPVILAVCVFCLFEGGIGAWLLVGARFRVGFVGGAASGSPDPLIRLRLRGCMNGDGCCRTSSVLDSLSIDSGSAGRFSFAFLTSGMIARRFKTFQRKVIALHESANDLRPKLHRAARLRVEAVVSGARCTQGCAPLGSRTELNRDGWKRISCRLARACVNCLGGDRNVLKGWR